MVRTDGRSVYVQVITKFSGMSRFTHGASLACERESSTDIYCLESIRYLRVFAREDNKLLIPDAKGNSEFSFPTERKPEDNFPCLG